MISIWVSEEPLPLLPSSKIFPNAIVLLLDVGSCVSDEDGMWIQHTPFIWVLCFQEERRGCDGPFELQLCDTVRAPVTHFFHVWYMHGICNFLWYILWVLRYGLSIAHSEFLFYRQEASGKSMSMEPAVRLWILFTLPGHSWNRVHINKSLRNIHWHLFSKAEASTRTLILSRAQNDPLR